MKKQLFHNLPPLYYIPLPNGGVLEVDRNMADGILPSWGKWRHPDPQHWHIVSAAAQERDGHRCVVCNSTEWIHVHHRTYERWGKEELSDLTTLCRDCHRLYEINKKMGA